MNDLDRLSAEMERLLDTIVDFHMAQRFRGAIRREKERAIRDRVAALRIPSIFDYPPDDPWVSIGGQAMRESSALASLGVSPTEPVTGTDPRD